MEDFYTKDKCDRCGGSLASGRIMSMFNEECICMKCKSDEMQRPDYDEAVRRDIEEHKKKNSFRCCICGKEVSGYGNNPFPVFENGRCCNKCNMNVVIPVRFANNNVLIEFARQLEDDED